MAVKRKAPAQASGSKNEPLREGEWNCAKCSAKNYSARISCYKCALSKRESELQTKGKAALDWECFKCKANNFSFRDSCFKCSISRFESDDIRALREGIPWVCRFCEIENRVTNTACFKCKRPQDIADVIPPRRAYSPPRGMMGPRDYGPRRSFSPPPMRYSFPVGQKLLPDPPSRPVSPLNKTPFLNRPLSPLPGTRSSDWQCLLCRTHNAPERKDCYKCTTIRGENVPIPSGPVSSRIGKGPKEGDWECTGCNFSNFKFRNKCKKCKANKSEDVKLTITINNDVSNPANDISLNHSMTKDDEPSPVKRRRMNYGEEGPSSSNRQKWGADWICGYCRVDIFPTRLDCYKCGRHRDSCELKDVGRRDMGPKDMGPRELGSRDMGPRDMGPRFDPRDRFGPDPRGRFGPDPRDRFSGPPDGFTCRCGNFNKMCELACVKCGRPNETDMRRDVPPGHQMWHSAQQPRRRFSPDRGGRRSPPRFYHEVPRNNKVALAKKAAAESKKKSKAKKPKSKEAVVKEEGKKKQDSFEWKCKECDIVNRNGRNKCFQCKKDRNEIEDCDWSTQFLSEVMDDYVKLVAEFEENKDKKFEEGDIDKKKLFRAKRLAKQLLLKAQSKENTDEAKTKEDTDEAKTKENTDEAKTKENTDEAETKENTDEAKAKENTDEAKSKENTDEAKTKENTDEAKTKENTDEAQTKENTDEAKTKENTDEAKTKENTDEIEKFQKMFDILLKLHKKVHHDLNADGGWQCRAADCDSFNFRKRTVCFKCKAKKPTSKESPGDDETKDDASAEKPPEEAATDVTENTEDDAKEDLVHDENTEDDAKEDLVHDEKTEETVKEGAGEDVEMSEQPVDFESDY